jgi:hypothetical protein
VLSKPYADEVLRRNLDPTPPQCRVSFDKDGHAVALTDLERSGKPAPAPTPMYAGVTANTPRVGDNFRSVKLVLTNGLFRISCPTARILTRKVRQTLRLIKSFTSISKNTLPPTQTISVSIGWSLGYIIHRKPIAQAKGGWWNGPSP